jgi:2-polyprenyl-3-methyl-5-hydroxy-6-metoxy-1,4-benzoquinol methylase
VKSHLNGASRNVERAIAAMRLEFQGNDWLLNEYWPQNEPHIRLMIADATTSFPPDPSVRLLDVGCFNGYISYLFRHLGYDVTGTDIYELDHRNALFERAGIEFIRANMNDPSPYNHLANEPFDIVIIAQVIEHILNHPLGLIRSLAAAMRPGGLMILTTPNPANIMNAARIVKGRSMLWGTQDFMDEPKFQGGKIISEGHIHYREYTRSELCHLLTVAGLRIEKLQYLGYGKNQAEPPMKRFLKSNLLIRKLTSRRLFASNHYFLARKV